MHLFHGRLCKAWVDHQEHWLLAQATRWRRSQRKWASRCIQTIIQATWNFRQEHNT